LEKWWQDVHSDWIRNNKDITVICPHPNYVFKEQSVHDVRNKISASHTITIDIEDEHSLQYSHKLINKNRQIRILIAESEPDLRDLYNVYLNGLGLEVIVIENGSKCIEYLLDSKDKEGFDMVIVDSHLHDINGVEVIKQIREKMPNQRIVFTTTHSLSEISNIIDSLQIDKEDLLLKPFTFTKLLSTIKPRTTIK
jgi:CheY-like chemotaxis protein